MGIRERGETAGEESGGGANKDEQGCARGSDPIEPGVLDICDVSEQEILRGDKAAGEGLGDVDPALLVSCGNQIKASEAKTQSESANTAKSELPGTLRERRPGKKERQGIAGDDTGGGVGKPNSGERNGEG